MKRTRSPLIALLSLVPAAALAQKPILHVDPSLKDCSVIFASELTQSAFQRFVREFGSVSAFKQMSSPTTLGKGGVALGLDQIFFTVDEASDAWNDTFAHPDSTHYLGSARDAGRRKGSGRSEQDPGAASDGMVRKLLRF